MSDTYKDFTDAVSNRLASLGEEPTGEADDSTLVHCFGYGKDVTDTVYNVLHGRSARVWLVESLTEPQTK